MQFSFTQLRAIGPVYRWGALALVVVVLLAWHFFARNTPKSENAALSQIAHVQLSSVASLSSATGPLPVTGKVTSRSQATVLAQGSGQIVTLRKSIGDRVSAGDVIATMENSSQQAAVTQAQGAYDAAQAALAKASGSTVQNSALTSSQAAQGAQNALSSTNVSMQSLYAALDDAVHSKTDTLFSNPRTNPVYSLTTPDSQLVIDIQNERAALDPLLSSTNALIGATASANVDANAASMIANAQTISAFLDHTISATNQAIATQSVTAAQIAADQTTLAAARSEVVAGISALTSAKAAYDAALTTSQTAANSASTANGSDIDAAKANVKQALGALDAAKANLEKTIIRSPISGTIVSLPVHQGDYVTSFAQVAQISNPQALEVDVYVTPDDAKTLAIGGKALIDGSSAGVITFIAPELDPSTNKIELKIGITSNQDALSDGDTETVTLDRANSDAGKKKSLQSQIVIPIVAAKITPGGPIVFSVGTSSELVGHPITLGTILGDQVTVLAGLTRDMTIVTDARGHSQGEKVVVDND